MTERYTERTAREKVLIELGRIDNAESLNEIIEFLTDVKGQFKDLNSARVYLLSQVGLIDDELASELHEYLRESQISRKRKAISGAFETDEVVDLIREIELDRLLENSTLNGSKYFQLANEKPIELSSEILFTLAQSNHSNLEANNTFTRGLLVQSGDDYFMITFAKLKSGWKPIDFKKTEHNEGGLFSFLRNKFKG